MHRTGLTTERITGLFVLAVLLFTPPFLGIFNSPVRVLGIPALYLYLFATWALLIGAIALAAEHAEEPVENVESGATAVNGAGFEPQGE